MKNDNSEVVGRTVFDFLTELLKRHGVWVVFICIFIFSGAWLFAHYGAKEGSDVSILGIIRYTKGSTKDDKNETENIPQGKSILTRKSDPQRQHSENTEEKEPTKPDTIETILSNEGGSQ